MTTQRKVALLGQPNSGKSTIFNMLTGSHQYVGNWPGKTVEKKEGHFIVLDGELRETQTTDYFSKHRRSDCAVRELTAR